jgi:hypothetical protein
MSTLKPILFPAAVALAVIFLVFKVVPASWKEAVTGMKAPPAPAT